MIYVSHLNTIGYKILLKITFIFNKSLKSYVHIVNSITKYNKPRHNIVNHSIMSQYGLKKVFKISRGQVTSPNNYINYKILR